MAALDSKERLFKLIHELVMHHSPSGVEGSIDSRLTQHFESLGVAVHQDQSGNLIARIPGQGQGTVAITAHKDEIGALVTELQDGGRLKVKKLGGSYPWVYGEGVVDLLGDSSVVSGVLSFGSRHVSHASPQHAHHDEAPVRWTDAWIETKLTADELRDAGIRVGTRVVIGKHRKAPFRLKDHVASYTLDNKASLAILLTLVARLEDPKPDIFLIATAKEEVGALGALFFTQRQPIDALIALEVSPIAPEYNVEDGVAPVLLVEDAFGIYDDDLNRSLMRAAASCRVPLQLAVVHEFGSDASVAMKAGHVPRAACLGFPTQNTHGFEIAHLGALENCVDVLAAFCSLFDSAVPKR